MDHPHRAPTATRERGVALLLRSGVATMVLGGLVAIAGWLIAGSAAGWGALVGAGLVVVVCAGGSLAVNAVAAMMPSASLLVALLTYTLQVAVLLLAFLGLERSGLLAATLDRTWLGVAAVLTTLEWLVAQVVLTFRTRIPVYDLPAEGGER